MKIISKKLKLACYVTLFLSAICSVNAQTQENQNLDSIKVAIIDTKSFYDEESGIREWVNAYKVFAKETALLIQEIKRLRGEMLILRNEFIKLTNCHYKCNPNSKEEINKKLAKYKKLHQEDKVLEGKHKEKESQVFEPINKKIEHAIKRFADKKGYKIILDTSKKDVVSCRKLDITKEFIKFYNSSNK